MGCMGEQAWWRTAGGAVQACGRVRGVWRCVPRADGASHAANRCEPSRRLLSGLSHGIVRIIHACARACQLLATDAAGVRLRDTGMPANWAYCAAKRLA